MARPGSSNAHADALASKLLRKARERRSRLRELPTLLSASAFEPDKIVGRALGGTGGSAAISKSARGRTRVSIATPSTNGFDYNPRHMFGWTTAAFLRPQRRMSTPGSHTEPMNGVERWIGRAAAICVHPVGAWRVPSTRVRLVLIFGYVATGYLVGILGAFFLLDAPPL